jgi:hypothetical protein
MTGDGSFNISINKNDNSKYVIAPAFSVNLHLRELDLIENLFKHFNCGFITKDEKNNKITFRIRNLTSILDIIIPFFNK